MNKEKNNILEKKKKTLHVKLGAALIIIMAALVLIYYYTLSPREITHVILNDKKTKVAIPAEIVKSKDCKKYHEWFYSNFTPLIKWSDACPWAKPPKGPIGEFIIEDTKLWIPREYIWPNQREPDGPSEGFNVLMVYPEMTPVTGDDKNSKCMKEDDCAIMLSISKSANWTPCREEGKCDAEQNAYKMHLNWRNLTNDEKAIYPKKIKYLSELDLTLYESRGSYDEVYLKGDKYHPDYWIVCLGGKRNENYNPICESGFNLNDKVYIKYSFNQEDLLIHHEEVRNKILEKFREWQQAPGDIK